MARRTSTAEAKGKISVDARMMAWRQAAGYRKNQMGGTVLKLLQTLMADAQDLVSRFAAVTVA